jgi:hypothetical protein
MDSIFINHSKQDTDFAQKLSADLRLGGYRAVTYADLERMEGGQETTLKERCADAIASSDYFVPVITSEVQDRGWFHQDLAIALQEEAPSGRVIILPVLKEHCLLPEPLGVRSPVDFSSSYEKGLHNLVDRLSVGAPNSGSGLKGWRLAAVEPDIMSVLWQRRDLRQLSWKRFEKLVAKTFEDRGCRVELTQFVKDGDIDLVAVGCSDQWKQRFLVQCKRYVPGNRVAVELVNSISPMDINFQDGKTHVVTTSTFVDAPGSALGRSSERLTRSRWEISPPAWESMKAWIAWLMKDVLEQPVDISQARERHADLVDKKFGSFLTDAEQAELLRLRVYLDEADSEFYKPIEEKLDAALAAAKSAQEV